jgi:hypothetical protein
LAADVRNLDDPPAALLAHGLEQGARELNRGHQGEGELLLHLCVSHLLRRTDQSAACIVDDAVDPSAREAASNHAVDMLSIRDVERCDHQALAVRLRQRAEGVWAPDDGHDVIALCQGERHQVPPESAGRARDDPVSRHLDLLRAKGFTILSKRLTRI